MYVGDNSSSNTREWAKGLTDHVVGECKYDFIGEREDELTVTAGQRINLAPAGRTVTSIVEIEKFHFLAKKNQEKTTLKIVTC